MNKIDNLLRALHFLRNRISRDLPIQHAALLLTVARYPGITMPELMQALDMPQGTVSRNVKVLSHSVVWQNGIAVPRGYGLLRTQPSVDNRQMLAVYLTGRGEALIEEVSRLLGNDFADDNGAGSSLRHRHADNPMGLPH
ncbi:MAG: MarR family winged helix-turn-helix transcriptional regulator [Desulfuromonadales bacterium]